MARINRVQKCRKAQGNCYTCHEPIEVGSAYSWSKANRFAPKYRWHTTCAAPRPSVLEGNYKIGMLMEAQEDAEDRLGELARPTTVADCESWLEELSSIRDDAAQAVRDVAEEYRQSASNIVDGFGHETEASYQQEEWADQVEASADEIDDVDFDEAPDPEDDPEEADIDSWADNCVSALTEAIEGIEFP